MTKQKKIKDFNKLLRHISKYSFVKSKIGKNISYNLFFLSNVIDYEIVVNSVLSNTKKSLYHMIENIEQNDLSLSEYKHTVAEITKFLTQKISIDKDTMMKIDKIFGLLSEYIFINDKKNVFSATNNLRSIKRYYTKVELAMQQCKLHGEINVLIRQLVGIKSNDIITTLNEISRKMYGK